MPSVEDPTAILMLDPEEVTFAATMHGGERVGTVSVTSGDGTAHIDTAALSEGWFSAEVQTAFDDDGGKVIILVIYALSINWSTNDFREASVRVYNDGGGEAYLTVRQRGRGILPDGWSIAVTPDPLEAPSTGGRTPYAAVAVTDDEGNSVAPGAVTLEETELPGWIEGVEYVMYGTDDMRFRLTAAANGTGSAREAEVRLIASANSLVASFTVSQDAPPASEWKPMLAGEFLDIRNNTWRAEILRRTADEVAVAELDFPADSPLVIEWPSAPFEDALWGSSATLRVISPGDRAYIDLYTVEPGTIRLDIYKNGVLHWSGMLDPEFYEEPYEKLQGYEVALTFTDFGILDRLKYDLTGAQAVTDIIAHAVEVSGINVTDTDLSAVGIGVADLFVMSDNFTDEEGEVSSLSEVLEGVLQPLGIRMAQRGGRVILFDLAGLRAAGGAGEAVWAGDSQTLGVDRVYNSVTVTFSPYVQSDLLKDALSFGAAFGAGSVNTGDYEDGDTSDPKFWTFFPDLTGAGVSGSQDYDFTLFASTLGSGVTFGNDAPLAQYFHILPIYGAAEECTGIPYLFTPLGDLLCRRGRIPAHSGTRQDRWFTLPRIYVPGNDTGHCLRLSVELLVDCRYNPFSGEADSNYESVQEDYLEKSSAFVFLPAWVTLYDSEEGGNAVCHYDNSAAAYYGADRRTAFQWVAGGADFGDCWLEWYNPEDLTDNSGGVGGWKGNRHCIGMPDGGGGGQSRATYAAVTAQLAHAADGEYIPLPPQGGWLEVAVGDDFAGFAYGGGHALGDTAYGDSWGESVNNRTVRDNLRWCLLRNPEISVVDNTLFLDDADLDDVEYRGTLDEAAQDDLSIDTICGTADGAPPTARGLFLGADGSQVSELTRGGVTDRPERLLIGQLYAQYASRKTVLTGEAETPETLLLTEQNQSGKTFILTGDTQDVRMAVSDIEIRELGEDTYTPE